MSKNSTSFKKGQIPWNKGLPGLIGDKNHFWGKKHTEETKNKISKANKGKKRSEEVKKKFSIIRKGLNTWTKGRKASEETKQKMRESRIKYIASVYGNVYPGIGKNEKEILDKLEQELGYRIIRQFEVGGYYVDGYIPEINLVIEVDEKYHDNQKEKDLKREEFIRAKLGCRFIRIKDFIK